MSTIFELTKEQAAIMSLVENEELTLDDVSDHIEFLKMEVEDKWNAYGRVNQHLTNQLNLIKEEEKRLKELKGQKESEIKRLKQTILAGMRSQDVTKFDTGLFKAHIRKGQPSVDVIEEDLIPAHYFNEKTVKTLDKNTLKADLKAGQEIEGASLSIGASTVVLK